MQKHDIEELERMLAPLVDSEPSKRMAMRDLPNGGKVLSIGLVRERMSHTFTIADSSVFFVSPGESVKWPEATDGDMANAVEFAKNWLNDAEGEF